MARHPHWTRHLFSDDDFEAIARSVAEAEAGVSAEIRVHLERRLPRPLFGKRPDALARARHVFGRLGMQRTRHRNAVLIYLAVEDRKLAVFGDEGIHARVGDDYWARVRDLMVEKMRAHSPREGLVAAVHELGRALREHFPREPGDNNELSNEVSTG